MNHRITVIGAGAAGMMAAIAAAETGVPPVLLERNDRPGRKLMITGKGRCNLTNQCTVRELVAAVPDNGRFLYGAFSRFTPDDMIRFCEENGLPVKTERGQRVFPVSDKAADVVDLLDRRCRALSVQRITARAARIRTADGAVTGVETEAGAFIAADRVILATGGASYPATGSTGDGYRMAQALGHTIVPPRPSLIPMVAEGRDCTEMMGLSLRNTGLRVTDDRGKVVYTDFGELLFTHFGVSGPIILSASAHLRDPKPGQYTLHLDLKPALDADRLDQRLQREIAQAPNKDFVNLLGALLPARMIPVFARRTQIPPHTKAHALTRELRHAVLAQFKDFAIVVHGFRPLAEAIVTAGGIRVSEIDPRTMASKRVRGLYACGEVLDVDAYTGGFNLQIAWSTGRAAGIAAAESCNNPVE